MEVRLVFAALAYLVPVVVLAVTTARRDKTLWELALDVPFAVALDLLSVLLLSLLVQVETAVFVARAAWLCAGGVSLWRRRRESVPRYPEALGRWGWAPALGAGAFVWLVCSSISGHYFIWDSQWHTSIVSSLTVQRLPFMNALSQHEIFHYHFTGDVLAAMLKALSFEAMSANRALALAHDLMFALTAASVSLLLRATGRLRGWTTALAPACLLLHGPIPLRTGLGITFFGYSYHPFLNLSYRPHYPPSMLLLTGALGAVLARVMVPAEVPAKRVLGAVAVMVTCLAITDETSTVLFGGGLGVLWLVQPTALADKRLSGLLRLLALPLLMVGANLLFRAALAPGSPVQKIELSPHWRVGMVWGGPLRLSSTDGLRAFFYDVLPLAAGGLALFIHAVRKASRSLLALTIMTWVVVATGVLVSLRVDINGDPQEVHRFFVAPFAFTVLFCLTTFGGMRPGSVERVLAVLGTVVPAAAQIYWVVQVAPEFLAPYKPYDVFSTDCRAAAGAHLGDTPRTTYVTGSDFFRYVGCRPVWSSGEGWLDWATKIQPNTEWSSQLAGLDRELRPRTSSLDVVCRSKGQASDPVCESALAKRHRCQPEGSDYVRCALTAEERKKVLRR